jgi:hypothetical protein
MRLCYVILFVFAMNSVFAQRLQHTYEKYSKSLNQKNWQQADKAIDSLLLLDPKNNYWLVSKAEVAAELGNYKVANQFLEKSIANGYLYLDEIVNDIHFKELRSTTEYKKLIASLETRLEKYRLSENDQQLTIDIPPLMECYVIILYLGNPKHTLINNRQNHFYFRRIDEYFKSFKTSNYVKALANKYPSNENEWINNLRAHHNLRTLYVYDSLNSNEIKRFPIELDYELAKMVEAFAKETDFIKFYRSNQEFYTAMKEIMRTNYSFGSNMIPFFNNNFDLKINRFNIYFSPIYGGWQHGPVAKIENYTECFYFGGIMYNDSDEFYYPDVNLYFTFLTEFDHTPINALTERYRNQIEKYSDRILYLNTSGKVSYGNMISTVEEYITWAFALQFFYETNQTDYPALERNIIYAMEKGRGFARFGDFMNFYKGYINSRGTYPKLDAFYPEIINWIADLK